MARWRFTWRSSTVCLTKDPAENPGPLPLVGDRCVGRPLFWPEVGEKRLSEAVRGHKVGGRRMAGGETRPLGRASRRPVAPWSWSFLLAPAHGRWPCACGGGHRRLRGVWALCERLPHGKPGCRTPGRGRNPRLAFLRSLRELWTMRDKLQPESHLARAVLQSGSAVARGAAQGVDQGLNAALASPVATGRSLDERTRFGRDASQAWTPAAVHRHSLSPIGSTGPRRAPEGCFSHNLCPGARTQPSGLSIRCRSRPANVEPKAIEWLYTVEYRTKCSGSQMWKLTNP